MDVSSLFNVLVSTFAVMLLGYLLPKLEYVDRGSVGKGLGGLVAKLLLPAVLFSAENAVRKTGELAAGTAALAMLRSVSRRFMRPPTLPPHARESQWI